MLASQIKKPSIADEEQDEDSPDKVMNVTPADHHPVKRADMVRDEADKDSHAEKCDEKCEGGDEESPTRAVGNGGADEKADVCEMEKEKKGGDYKGGENEKDQRAGSDFHSSIETPWEGRFEGKDDESGDLGAR